MLTPGERIKKERQRQGMSVNELAAKSKVDNRQIHWLEANNLCPSLLTMLKLCKALNVKLSIFECPIDVAYAIRLNTKWHVDDPPKQIPRRKYDKDGWEIREDE